LAAPRRGGNPLARTILTECAWASLRYNPWFKAVYDRVTGKQKTRKKKAAIALARKIAVIAWSMLRDEKDWDPNTMLTTTRMFNGGDITPQEETLKAMKPKENSDQRKSRLRREARQASQNATTPQTSPKSITSSKTPTTKATSPNRLRGQTGSKQDVKPATPKTTAKKTAKTTTQTGRARKPVSAV
jgi:transposase